MQKRTIRNGIDVLVATPGRLLDLASELGPSLLGSAEYLVLDEADRMLDQGFEKDIRNIVGQCNPRRQTALFSATWPEEIRKLAHEFLGNPLRIVIGSDDLTANKRVTQHVEVVEQREKERKLPLLLNKYHKSRKNRVLVFVLYKKEAALSLIHI